MYVRLAGFSLSESLHVIISMKLYHYYYFPPVLPDLLMHVSMWITFFAVLAIVDVIITIYAQ